MRTYQDIPGHYQVIWDILRHTRTYKDTPEHIRTHQDILGHARHTGHQNISGHMDILGHICEDIVYIRYTRTYQAYWDIPGHTRTEHTRTYQDLLTSGSTMTLGHTRTYQDIHGHTRTCQKTLGRTRTYQKILGHPRACIYQDILGHQGILGHTRHIWTYQYTLGCVHKDIHFTHTFPSVPFQICVFLDKGGSNTAQALNGWFNISICQKLD